MIGSLPFKVERENIYNKKIVWDGFSREEFSELDGTVKNFVEGLLEKSPEKRLKATEALQSSFFTNSKIKESFSTFCRQRIDERYSKILKLANIN